MRVDLTRFKIDEARFVEERKERFGYRVVVLLRVRAVATGLPEDITFTGPLRMDPENKKAAVRDLLIQAITHEIDECLYIDGERLTDPHPNG